MLRRFDVTTIQLPFKKALIPITTWFKPDYLNGNENDYLI